MTIPSFSTPPARTDSPEVFIQRADQFISELPAFVTSANADIATVNGLTAQTISYATQGATSASQAAISASQAVGASTLAASYGTASLWVSGSNYIVGNVRVSPSNGRLYKCILAATGRTTDPSNDTSYWVASFIDGMTQSLSFPSIQAALPAITLVDYCFHFAKDDTDLGAWRKRKGQSWRSEARSAGRYLGSYATVTAAVAAGGSLTDYYYNTTNSRFEEITATGTPASTATYRAGKEDYPTNALITVESTRGTIWDLDGAQPSMWMVWKNTATTGGYGLEGATSIAAINNYIVVGQNDTAGGAGNFDGLRVIDFIGDRFAWLWWVDSAAASVYVSTNGLGGASSVSYIGARMPWFCTSNIVNGQVNDVAITVLPDAPYDEYGMPIPTIAVATAGGVSEIRSDGTVVNSASTNAAYGIGYDSLGRIWWNTTTQYNVSGVPTRSASWAAAYTLSNAAYSATNVPISPAIATGAGKFAGDAVASTNGLTVTKVGQGTNALHAAITSTYNTGYMVGDIRRSFLANSKTVDRSVKAATLTEVGTVTETTYTGGRSVYSGFSAANYFQEASHADWNALGTGDFSIIMSGVKWGTAATLRTLISLGDGVSNGSVKLEQLAANTLRVSIYNAGWTTICTSTATFTDTTEHVVEVKRYTRSGVASTVVIIVDGVLVASAVSTLTISNATGYFRIGEGQDASQPWVGGQVSCVRISATAPTAEQSKFIAAQENALNGGATCILSNSSSVSSLQYHKDTDLLEIKNGTATDYFSGLARVGSVTTTSGITGATAEGQLPAYDLLTSGTTNTFWAAERNVKAELLEQVPVTKKTQQYSFTTPAATTTQALPKGWKAQGIAFNTTDSTFLGTWTQTFDGFIWTVAGLTASKAYRINLVEV